MTQRQPVDKQQIPLEDADRKALRSGDFREGESQRDLIRVPW